MSVSVKVNNVVIDNHIQGGFKVPAVKRLRDWSPVAEGFQLVWSANGPAPVKQQLVEVLVDGVEQYLGYIEDFTRNHRDETWQVEVLHWLLKLDNYDLQWNTLHSRLIDTGDGTELIFTADPGTNIITCGDHGLSTGDLIYVRSTSVLPAPLKATQYYSIEYIDINTFKIYGAVLTSVECDITTAGTGTHYLRIPDPHKYMCYQDWDDIAGRTSTTIAWLVQKVFELIGVELDTALVDAEDLYAKTISTPLKWNWNQLVVDENMLYCLNQGAAVYHTVLDVGNDYDKSKITCWEFVQDLFGRLGIALKYVGPIADKKYKLYVQKRLASTFPDFANEPIYDIPDFEKYDYNDRLIISDGQGYSHSRRFPGSGFIRPYYESETPTNVDETGYTRTNKGDHNVSVFNNFQIYLIDVFASSGADYMVLHDPSLHEFYQSAGGSVMTNAVYAAIMNFQQEQIKCPLKLTIPTVKEEYITVDDNGEFSEIIQEVNTLVSG